MAPDAETGDPDASWPSEAWEAEQRQAVADAIQHPVHDPQVQPDGGYYDAEAAQRADRLTETFTATGLVPPASHTMTRPAGIASPGRPATMAGPELGK